MKFWNFALLGTVLLISSSANASTLFDNGTTIDPSNAAWNNTSGWTIYDDFFLSEDSIITGINYSMYMGSDLKSNYEGTFVSILDSSGTVVSPFLAVGNLSANGLSSSYFGAPFGYDVNLSGLNLSLSAGDYTLGLLTEVVGGPVQIASGDTGYGTSLYQNTYSRPEHLVFSLEGIDSSSPPPAVPVPAAVWLFGSGLIGLVGFARRRKS